MRYIHQHDYAEARGFGEVKTKERVSDYYDLARDLLRYCIFSKESVDLNDMTSNRFFKP